MTSHQTQTACVASIRWRKEYLSFEMQRIIGNVYHSEHRSVPNRKLTRGLEDRGPCSLVLSKMLGFPTQSFVGLAIYNETWSPTRARFSTCEIQKGRAPWPPCCQLSSETPAPVIYRPETSGYGPVTYVPAKRGHKSHTIWLVSCTILACQCLENPLEGPLRISNRIRILLMRIIDMVGVSLSCRLSDAGLSWKGWHSFELEQWVCLKIPDSVPKCKSCETCA